MMVFLLWFLNNSQCFCRQCALNLSFFWPKTSPIFCFLRSSRFFSFLVESDRGYQGYRPIGGEFRYEVFIDRLVSLGCPFINSIKNNRLLVAAIELGRPRLVELFISNASNLNEPVEENTGVS